MAMSGLAPTSALPTAGVLPQQASQLVAPAVNGALTTPLLNAQNAAAALDPAALQQLAMQSAQQPAMQPTAPQDVTSPVAVADLTAARARTAARGTSKAARAKAAKARAARAKAAKARAAKGGRRAPTAHVAKAKKPVVTRVAPNDAAPIDAGAGTQQLPANATTIPGGVALSYDAQGNPLPINGVAGAVGVAAPTMQQFGLSPQLLNGISGYADGAATGQATPQVNATNQTNVNPAGVLNGLTGIPALSGLGQVPGMPIVGAAQNPANVAPGSRPGVQAVTNNNDHDAQGLGINNGMPFGGYGYGFGSPYGYGAPYTATGIGALPNYATGGIATPSTPFGASMTGAAMVTEQPKRGFFSRLFGL